MPSQLMPGATNWIRRTNRNMLGGPSRATHHITWDVIHEDGTRSITLDGVSKYLLNVGYEPHVVIDPFTGEVRELLDAQSSGYALQNTGVQTNRRGIVNLQVEWFFTPGTRYNGRVYNSLVDTPMLGLAEFLAWCDSWGIPRVAPLAPKDRNINTWNGVGGHYGHFNAPGNIHTDPIVSIQSILNKAKQVPAPTKPPEEVKFVPGTNIFTSRDSALVIEVPGGSTPQGSPLAQWSLNGRPHQLIIVENWAGYGTLRFAHARDLVVDQDVHSSRVQLWSPHGGDNQKWKLDWLDTPRGGWRVVNRATGHVLDVTGGSHDLGAPICAWVPLENLNQSFSVTHVG